MIVLGKLSDPELCADEVPLTTTVILMAIGMAGFLFVRFMYQRENAKRLRIIEDWTHDQFEEEACSEERRGDQRRTFMYGL